MTEIVIEIPSDTTAKSYGPVQLPHDSQYIEDEEEEIFLIYTQLQASPSQGPSDSSNFRGLGFLDSRKDVLNLSFELKPTLGSLESNINQKNRKSKSRKKVTPPQTETVEIQLLQDKTALRSRKGDTGSVVWKASIDFSRLILQQHRFPTENNLFDFERLKDSNVLELGAGTGLLSIVFSPLVKNYTVTDIPDLMPLIQKNIIQNFNGWPHLPPGSLGSNIRAEPLDWVLLHSSNDIQRQKSFTLNHPTDLILVVDCIYHPSLIPPLLSTLDHLTIPNKTVVLVLSELRSEEVLREFLGSWNAMPQWRIWHVSGDLLGDNRYVLWLGWKESCNNSLGQS